MSEMHSAQSFADVVNAVKQSMSVPVEITPEVSRNHLFVRQRSCGNVMLLVLSVCHSVQSTLDPHIVPTFVPYEAQVLGCNIRLKCLLDRVPTRPGKPVNIMEFRKI